MEWSANALIGLFAAARSGTGLMGRLDDSRCKGVGHPNAQLCRLRCPLTHSQLLASVFAHSHFLHSCNFFGQDPFEFLSAALDGATEGKYLSLAHPFGADSRNAKADYYHLDYIRLFVSGFSCRMLRVCRYGFHVKQSPVPFTDTINMM